MACPPLVISQGGTTLTFTPRHAEDLTQSIKPIARQQFHARDVTGNLIVQSLGWIRYKIDIKGSGELPNGLLKIDFEQQFDILTSVSNLIGGALTRHGTTFSWSEVNGVFVPGGGQESSNYIKMTVQAISHSVGAQAGGVASFELEAEEI